jgi:WD40 repeat protein
MRQADVDVLDRPAVLGRRTDWDSRVSFSDFAAPDDGTIHSIAWSPDGSRLAVTTFAQTADLGGSHGDGRVAIVNLEAQTEERRLDAKPIMATGALEWSPSGDYIAILEAGRIGIWDVVRGVMRTEISTGIAAPIAFSWNRQTADVAMVVIDHSRSAVVLLRASEDMDFNENREIPTDATQGHPMSVGWSPDGQRLAAVSVDRDDRYTLNVWEDPSEETMPTSVSLGRGIVEGLDLTRAWAPNGQSLALAIEPLTLVSSTPSARSDELIEDATLALWDRSELRTQSFDEEGLDVFGAAWSPDGRWISISTGDDLLFLSASTLGVVDIAPTFFTAVLGPTRGGEDDDLGLSGFTTLGFTICHCWAPSSRQVAVGNVGGLRILDVRALKAPND